MEWKLYRLITRHFLACCSDHAYGNETSLIVEVAGERFYGSGVKVTQRNFLEIYAPFDTWTEKIIHVERQKPLSSVYRLSVNLTEGKTEPLPLLSEADIIRKMVKYGIGTDATMHEHIHTICDRQYVEKIQPNLFCPTSLGLALVEGFQSYVPEMIDVSKPEFRSKMEADVALVAAGTKKKVEVTRVFIEDMQRVYALIVSNPQKMDGAMRSYLLSETTTPIVLSDQNSVTGFLNPAVGVLQVPPASMLTTYVTRNVSRCGCGGYLDMRTAPTPVGMKSLMPENTPSSNNRKPRRQRGNTSKRSQRKPAPDRLTPALYLVCSTSSQCPVLLLPNGNIEFSGVRHTCPLCGYQVCASH